MTPGQKQNKSKEVSAKLGCLAVIGIIVCIITALLLN